MTGAKPLLDGLCDEVSAKLLYLSPVFNTNPHSDPGKTGLGELLVTHRPFS